MRKIPLPRLLDQMYQEKSRLSPLSLSLHLRLFDLSTAEMLLPDDVMIALHDLVELYDETGSAGIFRVTRIQQDPGQTRRVFLTHSLCTLRDSATGSFSYSGPARSGIEQLLSRQEDPRWVLGQVELPEGVNLIYSTECTDLLSALTEVLAMLPLGYALTFNQAGSIWVMHLRALPETVSCEGRLGRNLQSVRILSDSSSLCTRVYPYGAKTDQIRLSLAPTEGVEYLQSEAAAELGVISRTFRSDRIFDVPTLRSVAEMYLARHSRPGMTIEANASDLSAATGQEMDSFRLGHLCRVALPDAGFSLNVRITELSRPDVYGTPGRALLTLQDPPPLLNANNEITGLLQQVTASRLLGGTITRTNDDNRADGSYPSPIVHYFEVPDGHSLLDAHITFTPDSGVSVTEVRIDDLYPPRTVWGGGSFSALPYLKKDALGCIASGTHKLILHPYTGQYGELGGVASRVTLTTVE